MRTTLLDDLGHVERGVLERIHGNCHATLIGALAIWWTRQGSAYRAFESGPSHGKQGTAKAGQCDAILACGTVPEIVVEVEGTNHLERLEQIGHFLESPREDLKGLHSGILIAYPTNGSDRNRVDCSALAKCAMEVTSTRALTSRAIVIVTIEKKRDESDEPSQPRLRRRHECYRATIRRVWAQRFSNGRVADSRCYFESDAGREVRTR